MCELQEITRDMVSQYISHLSEEMHYKGKFVLSNALGFAIWNDDFMENVIEQAKELQERNYDIGGEDSIADIVRAEFSIG